MVNIGIIGVGGVGGYFGGKLCRSLSANPDMNFYFMARGPHLEAIRQHGLRVSTSAEGEWVCRPTLATDHFTDLPPLDVCLLCVKSYDLPHTLARLKPVVVPTTLILPLLNGIDIYERIRAVISTGLVFPACVYVGTHIESYGKVAQKGGACKILLGKDPQTPNFKPQMLLDLLAQSQIKYEWFDDAYPQIWEKYVFIVAFGLVTAAFDKTLGQVMESKELSDKVIAVMSEIAKLARCQGVVLPETIVTDSHQKGGDFPYETKTSFQRDVEQPNKPDERDLFGATIIRLGLALGVKTPVTQELSEKLNLRKGLNL